MSRYYEGFAKPMGYVQLTTLSSAVGLTVPDGTDFAIIQAEAQNVRYRDDGTNPTATVGTILTTNNHFVYNGKLSAIKLFEVSARAILNVHFYQTIN